MNKLIFILKNTIDIMYPVNFISDKLIDISQESIYNKDDVGEDGNWVILRKIIKERS